MSTIMYTLLLALGGAGLSLLGFLFAKLKDYESSKVKSPYLQGVLLRLDDAVLNVVKSTYQTFVGPLKQAGGLSDANKAEAKAQALALLKSYLGEKGLAEAAKVLGLSSSAPAPVVVPDPVPVASANQLDTVLATKIEAAVMDLKK